MFKLGQARRNVCYVLSLTIFHIKGHLLPEVGHSVDDMGALEGIPEAGNVIQVPRYNLHSQIAEGFGFLRIHVSCQAAHMVLERVLEELLDN